VSEATLLHTADLDAATLSQARRLLDDVFGQEMTPEDWEHALGGLHALIWVDAELIGHASVVQRRLIHRGRALRAGYVEGVAVAGAHRGNGHGAALMRAIERVIRGAYHLGALGSTDEAAGFYVHRGWKCWEGRSSVLTPDGIVPTADCDGCIYVLPVNRQLDLTAELTCGWREGDVW
jgi:aminoglycoside 2'-N-acetyltransferase I